MVLQRTEAVVTVDAKALNRSAEFVPDDASPAVRIAGVLVTVRVSPSGVLMISADFDESQLEIDGITPVRVRLSGETVYLA